MLAILIAFLQSLALDVNAEVAVTGVDGVQVSLDKPARRIVSLSPHLTELLYKAGAGEKIVGAVAYSDYPPAARELPRVGDAFRLDLERIVALHPDLAVAWESGNAMESVHRLRELGIPVLVTEVHALSDIAEQLERLGKLGGTPREAAAAARAFRERIDELRAEYASREQVRVFYQATARPLYTVGGTHVITEIIELCGGRNVFDDQRTLAPAVSVEAVVAARPEAIIAGVGESEPAPLARWRQYASLPAAANGHLYSVPADLLHRSTTRIAYGAPLLCGHIEKARRSPQS